MPLSGHLTKDVWRQKQHFGIFRGIVGLGVRIIPRQDLETGVTVLPLEKAFMAYVLPSSRYDFIPWDVILSSAPEFIFLPHEC